MPSSGSKSPLRFRRVGRADADILAQISLDPALVSRFLGSLDAVAEAVRRGVAHVLVVAETGGRPIGFTVTHPDPEGGGRWWLAYLAVSDRARGQGLGRTLLARALRALSAAPGCREIRLLVDRENATARRLYDAMGFEAAEELDRGTEQVLVLRVRPVAPARRVRPRGSGLFAKRRRMRLRPNPGPHAARVIGLTRGPPGPAAVRAWPTRVPGHCPSPPVGPPGAGRIGRAPACHRAASRQIRSARAMPLLSARRGIGAVRP